MAVTKIPTIPETIGALFIGNLVSCVVLGVLLSQAYKYVRRYPGDRVAYKALVSSVIILELADQALITHASYFYAVVNYNNFGAILFGDVAASLILQIILGSVVGTIVRLCFCTRLWRFSKHNIPVTCLVGIVVLAHLGLAVAYTIQGFAKRKFAGIIDLRTLGLLSLGSGVFGDLLTAVALCYYLRQYKTGYSPSDNLVSSLSRYAINTGVVTSGVSLATLITYALRPSDLIFIGEYFVLSKLYAISLLATLNTRKIIRGRGTDHRSATQESHGVGSDPYQIQPPGTTRHVNKEGSPRQDWSYPPHQMHPAAPHSSFNSSSTSNPKDGTLIGGHPFSSPYTSFEEPAGILYNHSKGYGKYNQDVFPDQAYAL
jgi:hypothetical protein